MRAARRSLRTRRDEGASAVEYGLVVSLIAAVLVIAVFALGRVAAGQFGSIDCWSSTGGSSCSEAAAPLPAVESAPAVTAPTPTPPVVQPPATPAPAPSSTALCNQSSNGSGKGKGAGNCK